MGPKLCVGKTLTHLSLCLTIRLCNNCSTFQFWKKRALKHTCLVYNMIYNDAYDTHILLWIFLCCSPADHTSSDRPMIPPQPHHETQVCPRDWKTVVTFAINKYLRISVFWVSESFLLITKLCRVKVLRVFRWLVADCCGQLANQLTIIRPADFDLISKYHLL